LPPEQRDEWEDRLCIAIGCAVGLALRLRAAPGGRRARCTATTPGSGAGTPFGEPTGGEPWAGLAETHSAVVFFAGDRAYKRKKPVRFEFLDFSTPELRQQALARELALNRRLAPDVYLGIAELTLDGRVVDHVLVMRRLPVERRLSTLVQAHAPCEDEVRAVARTVAVFHARAAGGPANCSVPATRPG